MAGVTGRPGMDGITRPSRSLSTIRESGEVPSTRDLLSETGKWMRKYFWEGQQLAGYMAEVQQMDRAEQSWLLRHWRLIGMVIPGIFFHAIWWVIMSMGGLFFLFTEKAGDTEIPRFYMTVTMALGSLIAGSTSEGGGAIAFPVLTLVFHTLPSVARDFSLMIQSIGMTCAAFTIMFMQVRCDFRSLSFVSIGGVAGIIFGLEKVAPLLEPAYSKMYFVVIWFAFAFSLYRLNRNFGRRVFSAVPDFWERYRGVPWKVVVLVLVGFVGGIFSSMSGSGIDICSFAALTLIFRVSEKVATPTSVIMMAVNAAVGFIYKEFIGGGVEEDAWHFFAVCVPVVVIGAPFGSVLGSHFHRLVLAGLIYVLDTIQFILALSVVKPWLHARAGGSTNTPLALCMTSGAILLFGIIVFKIMEIVGQKLLVIQEEMEDIKAMEHGSDDEQRDDMEIGPGRPKGTNSIPISAGMRV